MTILGLGAARVSCDSHHLGPRIPTISNVRGQMSGLYQINLSTVYEQRAETGSAKVSETDTGAVCVCVCCVCVCVSVCVCESVSVCV